MILGYICMCQVRTSSNGKIQVICNYCRCSSCRGNDRLMEKSEQYGILIQLTQLKALITSSKFMEFFFYSLRSLSLLVSVFGAGSHGPSFLNINN